MDNLQVRLPKDDLEVLDRLAAGTFHMAVALYQRARASMERA